MKSEKEIRERIEEEKKQFITANASIRAREAKAYDDGFIDALQWVLNE